ncbi:MAG: bifunctional demethylmenaquinone methyltransferase/2-methoxy-6-polyprenyl-1,4-benzoquinol methylase UbiE [Desulfomonilaceae bacterium]
MESRSIKNWTAEQRITAVKDMFNSITPHYDLLNRVLSARRDVSWRKFVVTRIPAQAERILDLATGTGDLAIEIARGLPQGRVTGADFVPKMMEPAQLKTQSKGLSSRINYVAADATKLPFPSHEFDVVTIAFGLRNIPDRFAALQEMKRVVKPGGKLITLEMTFPKSLGLRGFFKWYLNHVIPTVGGIISGNRQAYSYLPESIQDFLTPDQLSELFKSSGFESVRAFPLTFGLTYVHEGIAAGHHNLQTVLKC